MFHLACRSRRETRSLLVSFVPVSIMYSPASDVRPPQPPPRRTLTLCLSSAAPLHATPPAYLLPSYRNEERGERALNGHIQIPASSICERPRLRVGGTSIAVQPQLASDNCGHNHDHTRERDALRRHPRHASGVAPHTCRCCARPSLGPPSSSIILGSPTIEEPLDDARVLVPKGDAVGEGDA